VLTYTLYWALFLLTGAAYEQQKLMKLQEQERKNMEQEIDNFNSEVNKQSKIIASLEKERDR
jgi:septal ring factor EnvC (AmiA/AmiB activator)